VSNYKIIISERELNNLKIFLSRVDLKGSEALEFMSIVNTIEQAEVIKNG
jgi:hypothetical protein